MQTVWCVRYLARFLPSGGGWSNFLGLLSDRLRLVLGEELVMSRDMKRDRVLGCSPPPDTPLHPSRSWLMDSWSANRGTRHSSSSCMGDKIAFSGLVDKDDIISWLWNSIVVYFYLNSFYLTVKKASRLIFQSSLRVDPTVKKASRLIRESTTFSPLWGNMQWAPWPVCHDWQIKKGILSNLICYLMIMWLYTWKGSTGN